MRRSTRIACLLSWLVFIAASVVAWRQLPPLPYGDPTRLFVADLAGALGLGLVCSWAGARDRARRALNR